MQKPAAGNCDNYSGAAQSRADLSITSQTTRSLAKVTVSSSLSIFRFLIGCLPFSLNQGKICLDKYFFFCPPPSIWKNRENVIRISVLRRIPESGKVNDTVVMCDGAAHSHIHSRPALSCLHLHIAITYYRTEKCGFQLQQRTIRVKAVLLIPFEFCASGHRCFISCLGCFSQIET